MNTIPYKVAKIGGGKLFIMPKPIAGEYVDEEFQSLSQQGINLIASLLERSESYEVGLSKEADYCDKWDIGFINFPIKDRESPDKLRQFNEFITKLHTEISQGRHAAVHCRIGIGRAGLVSACTLMHEGHSAADAFAVVSNARGIKVPDTEEQYHWCAGAYANYIQR